MYPGVEIFDRKPRRVSVDQLRPELLQFAGLEGRSRLADSIGGSLARQPRWLNPKLIYDSSDEEIYSVFPRRSSDGDVVKDKEKSSDVDGGLSINKAEMVVDPDSDSSSLCTACRIPIFSTPSISLSHGGEKLFLHEQCATVHPEQLVHELHPNHTLVLVNQLHLPTPLAASTCSSCKEVCGTLFYKCLSCDFRLDILCVSQIRILHRSHGHSMMVVRLRDSASLTCSACDNKHVSLEPGSKELATLSYLCNPCGYWIHPDCASLPNAIVHYDNHQHCLYLTYSLFQTYGMPSRIDSKCVICSNELKKTSGFYICLLCDDYVVHVRCALTRPKSFKPVFIRDAEVGDLAHLPMADENISLIPYIKSSSVDGGNEKMFHQHPLTFHGSDDGRRSISTTSRVCNACVQFVSPPFYSCCECPDFFLHASCARLPSKIEHRVHKHPLTLSLKLKPSKSDVSGSFSCIGCGVRTNGFVYSCESCGFDGYDMDVVCGLLNPAITHDSHEKTHILFMSRDVDFGSDQVCNFCSSRLSGICYECNICPKFKLHVRCALLPSTVSHSFDRHPLQLTTTPPEKRSDTTSDGDEICEVCEEEMERKKWHYSCGECDQSFHIDCIPYVDRLSRIKLGSTISIEGHGCPLTLVREEDAVCVGRRCGVCGEVLKSSDDGLAYECSKCFFGIHHKCVDEKLMLKS